MQRHPEVGTAARLWFRVKRVQGRVKRLVNKHPAACSLTSMAVFWVAIGFTYTGLSYIYFPLFVVWGLYYACLVGDMFRYIRALSSWESFVEYQLKEKVRPQVVRQEREEGSSLLEAEQNADYVTEEFREILMAKPPPVRDWRIFRNRRQS